MANTAYTHLVVLSADMVGEDRLQWIEVMPTADKARNGPFYFTVTTEDLEAYAAYIQENGDRIVVDYDHEGADGGSTVAAGWFTGNARVTETEDRGPILEAEVEWTPQGLADVQSKRFRFISPEFTFADRDGKTGLLTRAKEMLAATLTNRPFFQKLAAVASEQEDAEQQVTDTADVTPEDVADTQSGEAATEEGDTVQESLTAVAAELGLADDATDEEVLAAIKAAKTKADEAAALDAERQRLAARRNTTTSGGTMHQDDLIAALGLADDADAAEVLAAVRRAKAGADRMSDLEAENERLTAVAAREKKMEERLKTLEAERRHEKIERILADGVRTGRVFPAEKAALAKQFASNPDGLAEIIQARPEHAFALAGRGGNVDLDEGDDIISVKAQFHSDEADGVDTDSARLHVRATQILREQGKRTYTDAEYLEALAQASETYV